mmetsp:Transcript_28768/g.37775  ORF Transcript_28768/g.37775 Transcript_28768/m.37775 type:complete len:161 (-) Transcript_28768:297-779(-)
MESLFTVITLFFCFVLNLIYCYADLLSEVGEEIGKSCLMPEEDCYGMTPDCFFDGIRNAVLSDDENENQEKIKQAFKLLDSKQRGELFIDDFNDFVENNVGEECDELSPRKFPWIYTMILGSDRDTSLTIDFEEFALTVLHDIEDNVDDGNFDDNVDDNT